jgi:feruloyl esterase
MHADAELGAFLARGGKLMLYIGWNDYHNPEELLAYYRAVLKNAAGDEARNAVRLFLIPGMNHCSGGQGCDTFDKIGSMDQWVTSGTAPDRVLATRVVNGRVVRSRPLCAYPKAAAYTGAGDIDEASSFVCTEDGPTAGR